MEQFNARIYPIFQIIFYDFMKFDIVRSIKKFINKILKTDIHFIVLNKKLFKNSDKHPGLDHFNGYILEMQKGNNISPEIAKKVKIHVEMVCTFLVKYIRKNKFNY